MGGLLASFLLLTLMGLLAALPVLLPPLRRWLRGHVWRRVLTMGLLGGLAFCATYLLFAFVGAQIQVVLFCYPEGDWVCQPETAAELGFASVPELETALVQELFRRQSALPFWRQDCYSENEAFCTFVPSSNPLSANPLGLLVLGWPAFMAALLIWYWTRPPRHAPLP